jgi:VCBS repeat-containing protein
MNLYKLFVKASVIMKINSNLKKIATALIALLIIICAFTPVVSAQVDKSVDIMNTYNETVTESDENSIFKNKFRLLLDTFVRIIFNLMSNIRNKSLLNTLQNIIAKLTAEDGEIMDIDPNLTLSSNNDHDNTNNDLITQEIIIPLDQSRADVWNVTLELTEPNGGYDNAIFGEKTDASDGLDSYDVPKSPASIPPYIRSWFTTNFSDPYDELWEEFKHYPDTYKVWNLTVQWVPSDYSSPTTITISWNTTFVNNSEYYSVVLYDIGSSTEVADMLVDSNYTFTCPALALQNYRIICDIITNLPPVANDDYYTTAEETILNVAAPGVLTNDTDPDDDSLTAITDVTNGTLTLNTNGSFTYTPDINFNGIDTFTYKANDTITESNTATVYITVTAVNDPPVAVDDSYSMNEETLLSVSLPGVLVNDLDNESDPLTAVLDVGPTNAISFILNSDGSFNYTHDGSETTSDSFTYHANDGTADSNIATVTITINPINDPPVANDDSYSVNETSTLNIVAAGVLGNDVDNESDPLTAVLDTGPIYASSFILNSDGSFNCNSNIATVTITINPINDPPVANDDSYSVDEDTLLSVTSPGVLGNDLDNESNPLTAVFDVGPTNAISFILNSDGSFNYTPIPNYNGTDSFTYHANDGVADSNIATVTITINPINDPPVANDDSYSVNEASTLNIAASGVLGNDVDNESDPLTAVLDTGPIYASSFILNSDGSFNSSMHPASY